MIFSLRQTTVKSMLYQGKAADNSKKKNFKALEE